MWQIRYLARRGAVIAMWLAGSCTPVQAQVIEKPPVNIQLEDTLLQVDTVAVRAYASSGGTMRLPGSVAILTGGQIRLGDRQQLATVLNTLPGVFMQSGSQGTNRITIRGMGSRTPYNSNRIRAYLNDIPLTSSDGVSTPEEIELTALERIEVVKGPASAMHGSGLGGSLHLYTHDHPRSGLGATLQAGSFGALQGLVRAGASADHANYEVVASSRLGSGYRENSAFHRHSLLAAGRIGEKRWSIDGTLWLTDARGEIPSSLGSTDFNEDPSRAAANWREAAGFERSRKGLAGISLTNYLNTRWANRLTVYGRIHDGFEHRPFNDLDDLSVGGGFRNRLMHHRDRSDWVFGSELMSEDYHWSFLLADTLLNANRENRMQWDHFIMVYLRPHPKWNISAALALNNTRFRLDDQYEPNGDQSALRRFEPMLSPRLGFNYAWSRRWALYASGGAGFSMPSPEETLLPEGSVNPEIRPERGIQTEAGLRYYAPSGRMSAEGGLYWIELKDLLVTQRIAEDIFTGVNAGRSRHVGWELQGRIQWLDAERFPGSLHTVTSYFSTVNRFVDFTDRGEVYDGKVLPGIPRRQIQVLVEWKPWSTVTLSGQGQYVGSQFVNDANTISTREYFLVNLQGEWIHRLSWGRIGVRAGVNNLSDVRYASMVVVNAVAFGGREPRYYYPGLPRHFFVSLTIESGRGD